MPHNFTYREGELFCEEAPVKGLIEEHGSPLYVYSKESMLARVQSIKDVFAEHELDLLIAYSVKANSNLSVIKLLKEQGCGADIVSGGELHRALLAGVPADTIIYSGVGKTERELREALDAGILCFNVESEGELYLLAEVAKGMNKVAPVSIRVNPDVSGETFHHYIDTGHKQTKFGVSTDVAIRLYDFALNDEFLNPIGIDSHVGSQIMDHGPYLRSLLRLLELIEALKGMGCPLKYLDLGGGLGVSYELDEEAEHKPEILARELKPHLKELGMTLILEPGRFIVGQAGVLVTKVLFVKENGGKTFVITDAGMNDLIRPSHYSSFHHISLVRQTNGSESEKRLVDVVGPICETGDFLALDRKISVPKPGDLIVVYTAGAYGFTMASTYNSRPRPAEVLVSGQTTKLIRERETYQDLVKGEKSFI